MKKLLILLIASLSLLSFTKEPTYKFEFTQQDIDAIYSCVKTSEVITAKQALQITAKIEQQYAKQTDTANKK